MMAKIDAQVMWDGFRRNAVVIFPTIIAAIQAALTEQKWESALYVAVGVLLRQKFTSPTHEVQARQDNAYLEGFNDGSAQRFNQGS